MYYVYVLKSLKDHEWYTGCTADIGKRFVEHTSGWQCSTKYRGPFELIYYEFCLNKKDAFRREVYLKSGVGKKYLKKRLEQYFDE